MKHAPRIATALTATVLAAAALTACSSNNDDDRPSSASSVPASAPFNDADVAFATDMIPHHAQALVMVDMTRGRQLDPQFAKLAQQILDAQGPEIQEMTGWLQDWDQPVPATARDHVHADDPESEGDGMGGMDGMGGDDSGESGDDTGTDMPGMMSDQDMSDLEHASDATFEDMWLRMMIAHHEGAIEMARTEVRDGEYADAIALAKSIESSQARQIDRMKAMLEQ